MNLPLFPLPNLVLFPQVAVPLHIFEERYKLMINRCIDNSEVFGLVLLRPGAEEERESTIHRVGVTARVVEVDRLQDGRMNILCAAESRFRIDHFTGKSPYWEASVDLFEDDEEPEDLVRPDYEEVAKLYRRSLELSSDLRSIETEDLALPESPVGLSYVVSYTLNLDPAQKQALLETTSTSERLRTLVGHLEENLRELELQVARKQIGAKVRGNGDLGKPHEK
jgi:Lon protease-like protein